MTTAKRDKPSKTIGCGDFVALVALSAKDGTVFATPGDACVRVPAISLPALRAHDPQMVIAADVWETLSPEQRDWLQARTQRNEPYRHLNDPDDADYGWLVTAGLVPKKAKE